MVRFLVGWLVGLFVCCCKGGVGGGGVFDLFFFCVWSAISILFTIS